MGSTEKKTIRLQNPIMLSGTIGAFLFGVLVVFIFFRNAPIEKAILLSAFSLPQAIFFGFMVGVFVKLQI